MSAVAAGCVVLAAAAVVWPAGGTRARQRQVLGLGSPTSWPQRWRGARATLLERSARTGNAWALVAGGVVLATVLGGVVAGVVAGAYGALAARAVIRRGREQSRVRRRGELLDALGAAAADLRAGLPAGSALGFASGGPDQGTADPLLARVRAAVRLADRTGAPLAEVLERIEADVRGTDRARSASAAQAAGSRATAWLLAALPVGGAGLGYAIGADPLAVLLHTPIGAACALGSLALQLAGLAWTGRIARPASAVAP